MNNPIYLYDPGYPTAVRRCLGFHEDTLVQAEVPLGWHHGPRKGILIPDLMVRLRGQHSRRHRPARLLH